MSELPDQKRVIATLRPILDMISEWLHDSIDRTHRHFRGTGLEMDNGLFAYTVRAFVRQSARASAQGIVDEKGESLEVGQPAMIGLWFRFAGYAVRMYKSQRDRYLAKPGSLGTYRFLCQLEPIQPTLFDPEEKRASRANIAILWSLDEQYELSQVRVVFPSGFDAKELRVLWEQEIGFGTTARVRDWVAITSHDDDLDVQADSRFSIPESQVEGGLADDDTLWPGLPG